LLGLLTVVQGDANQCFPLFAVGKNRGGDGLIPSGEDLATRCSQATGKAPISETPLGFGYRHCRVSDSLVLRNTERKSVSCPSNNGRSLIGAALNQGLLAHCLAAVHGHQQSAGGKSGGDFEAASVFSTVSVMVLVISLYPRHGRPNTLAGPIRRTGPIFPIEPT
jgi:hypothetical protein